MCGIAGYFGCERPDLLGDMARALSHRGPDGEGIWHDSEAGVGLAHRRLAIIDTSSAAAQPMESCNGRYRVVFNGEIYNFRALGRILVRQGYRFNLNSDTAILGPLYDRYGPAMLERLNGIFAFALWDSLERELFIARDRAGVKPLYYTAASNQIVFASELKALLCAAGIDRTLDLGAVHDYLVHLWSPGARTMLQSVSKLLPGHFIRANTAGIAIERWVESLPARAPVKAESAAAHTSRLAALFDEVVSDQCVSDVPVGAFLSGGVDSSAVVAAMVATGHRPAQTYCIGFDGQNMADEGFGDDLAYARSVARQLGVPLTPIMVKEVEATDIERLAWMLDEPQADPAALYVEAISAAARKDGIKVLMSGAGGDDIFSGYRRHQAAALRSQLGRMGKVIGAALSMAPAGRSATLRRLEKLKYMWGDGDDAFLMRSFEFNRQEDAVACLLPEARYRNSCGGRQPPNALEEGLRASNGSNLLERMLFMELQGFLPDHNLNYTDKASMAQGVEVRVPFLDERLLEFARGTPWFLKVRRGSTKWVLKQAVAPRLPKEVLTRAKTGFGAPVRRWIEGRLQPLVMDIVTSQSFRGRGIFNPQEVERLIRDAKTGRRDVAYLVLSIVVMELWMKRFLDAPAQPPKNITSSPALTAT
jgi:asparagine synthase (glutamine-hydrolysing)